MSFVYAKYLRNAGRRERRTFLVRCLSYKSWRETQREKEREEERGSHSCCSFNVGSILNPLNRKKKVALLGKYN